MSPMWRGDGGKATQLSSNASSLPWLNPTPTDTNSRERQVLQKQEQSHSFQRVPQDGQHLGLI